MSYNPIPLQDLSSLTTPSESDSDSSEIFVDIDSYTNKAGPPEDFSTDPSFQNQLQRFRGSTVISKKSCSVVLLFCVVVWAAALVFYSGGNAHKIAHSVWHGSETNQVLLADRNVTLNAYLPKNTNVSMADYRKGLYWPDTKMVRWLTPAQFPKLDSSGYYLTFEKQKFVVKQANSGFSQVVLDSIQFEYSNDFFYVEDLVLDPAHSIDDENAWHLIRSDLTPQWRHLAFSLYWMWNPTYGEIRPIQPFGQDTALEKLHFAHFDPSGKLVVFGHDHDLYIYDTASHGNTRVTANGSPEIFNGKPDWIYEEEVYPHNRMVWWSPDLKLLVFASIDDSKVADYKLDFYLKEDVAMSYEDEPADQIDGVNQYPLRTSIKYPKPGTNNPIVTLAVYHLESGDISTVDISDSDIGQDFILYDVVWIDNDHLLLKLADRTSTILERKIFVASKNEVQLQAKSNTTDFNGWVEKSLPIAVVDGKYLDKVVKDGVVQLALFTPGSTDVSVLGPVHYNSPLAYNALEKVVYCVVGTNMTAHLALVTLDGKFEVLTSGTGDYSPTFSSDGQFVNLLYRGPLEPWQKLVDMAEWHDGKGPEELEPVNDVKRLSNKLRQTNLPTRIRSQIRVGHPPQAVQVHIMEIFPPNFDPKRKHPLLVYVYGGPGNTLVDLQFLVDFQDTVSSELGAVVLLIDPRGTGSDDWKSKAYASGKLGFWEPRDITAVTKDYIKRNKYVDDQKTAIWGWSYGGFTTLKTLEYDQGQVFKFGMAVAPVTNWLFYDSIYTERYMKNPKENANYKAISRINGFENFKNVRRFLVMHGTADDNVHLQNTLWLMDNFDMKGVENYDVHFFPDSDHSIHYHNANDIIFDKLFSWLQRAFQGFYD